MFKTGSPAARCFWNRLAGVLLIVLASAWPAWGAEYFVGLHGRDDADGRTHQTAFRTVQKGVDALAAGDTLTIGPGEYFERVSRKDLGNADVDTVIRAQIPRTAVLRGDVPAPQFKKVDGYRFVYAAPLEQAPQVVIEHHKWHILHPKANPAELEFGPGFFHYDAAAKMLYISNPDLSPPDQHRYTLVTTEGTGLWLSNPRRVIIDGLSAGGYSGCGINFDVPNSCTVRHCVTFLSQIGIRMGPADKLGGESGSKNLIEHCDSFGHSFGGIVRYGANEDVIRHCRTYKSKREGSEHFGIMHYVGMPGPLLIADNISWGQNFDYSVKPVAKERLERNVALGYIRNANLFNCLVGGGNEYDRGPTTVTTPDNILFVREQKLDRNFEFADPQNLDFRLQPDSRFRGTGPDKSDRGPYPYAANIFYLATSGDDAADGLSMRKPWRTLERGLQALRPGDTLYLDEGEYAGVNWNKPGDGKTPIRVAARGRGIVVIKGKLTVAGAAALKLERLAFADGVALTSSSDIAFNNCTFFGSAEGLSADKVKTLSVMHSLFAGVPLALQRSEAVRLGGNIFANAGAPALKLDKTAAITHSDYNSYQDAAQCWLVKGSRQSLQEVQGQHERYSLTLAPELRVQSGVPQLVNVSRFQSLGPHSTTLGLHHDYDVAAESLDLVGPFLHSATDTTANLEWWSSRPATFALAWGDTPEMTKVVNGIKSGQRFNTFTLSGLTPGQTYYFSIRSAEAVPVDGNTLPVLKPKASPLQITTAAAARQATVFYVAADGDDSRDGLSRQNAFRTIKQAADRVGPGDTVMIAAGEYNESLRLRAAGTKDRPITFRAVPGERAVIKGDNLARAFELYQKPDIHFDGLYFEGFNEVFVIRRSERVRITRCFNAMVAADESPELVVRNCVARGGWGSITISRSPRSAVENNVFVMTILQHVSTEDPTVTVRGNIFCECVRNKTHQTLLFLNEKGIESDNCFYLRWPEDERLVVSNRTLPQYRLRSGSNSVAANPMMAGVPGWKQGWQQASGKDFHEFFTGNPRLILRGIGLQPEAFEGFAFSATPWPLTKAWAQSVIAAEEAAAALAKAGKHTEAIAAYETLAAGTPLPERLKAEYLEQASRCAQRAGDLDQAMKLAKSIPLRPISVLRQMELMIERKDYAGLLNSFTSAKMGGQNFHQSWTYPELEDVMTDLYYYRSIAYRETGDLAAAEADLKIMNDKRTQLTYRCGEVIHDLVSLRLGDFYRDALKDDERALAAYQSVLDRTTWSPFGRPRKPAARGADETLVAATKAASEILARQGKQSEVVQLQFNLLIARADAEAAMLRQEQALALFKEALAVPGKFTPALAAAAGRIAALKDEDRKKLAIAIGSLVTEVNDDARGLLIRLAGGPIAADQDIALRTILLLAPADKLSELLSKAESPKP